MKKARGGPGPVVFRGRVRDECHRWCQIELPFQGLGDPANQFLLLRGIGQTPKLTARAKQSLPAAGGDAVEGGGKDSSQSAGLAVPVLNYSAERRFPGQGIGHENGFAVEKAGAGTAFTQTQDGDGMTFHGPGIHWFRYAGAGINVFRA